MIDDGGREPVFDDDRLTDMEVAVKLSLLMESDCQFREIYDRLNGENAYRGLVENALKKMSNPFAKQFLKSRMAKQYENSIII